MKKNILVVDDDLMIRELLKFKLSRLGFRVIAAGNEKEFWEQSFKAKPDLIILDILLKNKNGSSVYQDLIDFVDLDPNIPVIFITAFLNKKMMPEKSSAKYAFLSKPFNFKELTGEINRLLELSPQTKRAGAFAVCSLLFSLLLSHVPNAAAQEITDYPVRNFSQKIKSFILQGTKIRPAGLRPVTYGTAAWYSKEDLRIHHHTANGEVFNDAKQTCAVWDYPFNTSLKVTNLKNQKSVICRVNDRGPAKRLGRRLDLSKAAFRKIANLDRGVIKVSVAPMGIG